MNLTANDIIKAALRLVGAVAKSEVPTADEMQDGLQAMNMMIDLWSAQNLMMLASVNESFSLTAGTRTYTIGTGGAFNTAKPYRINGAYIRDGNNIDMGIDVISREQYDGQIDKFTQARPMAIMYDPGATQQVSPLGTIYLYYVPDSSTPYTLFLDSQKKLSELSLLTSSVTFDSMYAEAIKYNLTLRLWREYHDDAKPIPPDISALAAESLRIIEAMNSTPIIGRMEIPGVKSAFNIYTGDYIGQ